ncbi:MAG TPA: glycosyltransferase family 2 protein [Thermoleophilaceae bacterium]|nr:glycosyltransferase family 2 protein [Thermoleophilaceae bacterium]
MLALLTVTHDSRPELEALLRSVDEHLPGAEVVVADSGSTDGSADAARAWSGGARVVELGENVGFGRANNAGLAEVRQPVTVLVNPDVELVDDSLRALADEAQAGPERLLAPTVLLPGGRLQDSVQLDPRSPLRLPQVVLPGRLLPAAVQPWKATEPRRVGWAVGCCIAARTEVLRALGPFADDVFLYGEDLDLGLRAAERGIDTWFWPQARVLHRRAHTTARAFGGEPYDLLARRRLEVVEKRRGRRAALLDAAVLAATHAIRAPFSRRDRAHLAATVRAARASRTP